MTLDTVDLDGCRVHVLGVVKGLLSETKTVESAFKKTNPGKVAVSLTEENIKALREIPDDYEPELSRYEEIYVKGLSRFGEVAAPPPCYVATIELADHFRVPLIPIDMDEKSYTDYYCAVVGGGTLFRHSTRTWIVKRRKFSTESAEKFVLAWDKAVNGLEGFRMLEQKRAEYMAKAIERECQGTKSVLAVIELERAGDVVELLRGCRHAAPSNENGKEEG